MVKFQDYFLVVEVCKIKGIAIKALRYYHKMGIFISKYIDQDSVNRIIGFGLFNDILDTKTYSSQIQIFLDNYN
ncbi:hypothetical protein [Terrisporobacter vanillatitrophus]|uniref:hypothetical protein n=1 Tax=Terrisporobacter vanillatitrophus TaxID=3058402 RepID=UPI003EB78D78